MTKALHHVLRTHADAALERAEQLAQQLTSSARPDVHTLIELEQVLDDLDRYQRLADRITTAPTQTGLEHTVR